MLLHPKVVAPSGSPSILACWNPNIVKALDDSDLPVWPYLYSTVADVAYDASLIPENAIVFAPSIGDKFPSSLTSRFRIFSCCPRQFDVYVLPYALPELDDPVLKDEVSYRSNYFSFTGSLTSNTWRVVLANSFLRPYQELEASFDITQGYFPALADPTVLLQLRTRHLNEPCCHISKHALRRHYWRELFAAQYALCPIGDHHGSQRLIEAAYAGATPILIGDPWKTSVPACIRSYVFSVPALIEIPGIVKDYTIPDEQIYCSDDPQYLEPHVTPAWVYNPDPTAILDLTCLPRLPTHCLPIPEADAALLHHTRLVDYIQYELLHRRNGCPKNHILTPLVPIPVPNATH